MKHPVIAAIAALALAACAAQTSVEVGAAPDGGANRRYILGTEWNARDLNWEHVIAIHSTTSWICTGNGLGVEITGGDPHRHYPISSITRAPDPPPQGR